MTIISPENDENKQLYIENNDSRIVVVVVVVTDRQKLKQNSCLEGRTPM